MKKIFIFIFCAAGIVALNAKPAYHGPVKVMQADGSTITMYQHGDEFYHWTTNAKGEWLTRNAKGMYEKTPALSGEEITARRKAHRMFAPAAQQASVKTNLAPRGLMILVNFQDVAFQAENTQEVYTEMLNSDHYEYSYSYSYDKQKFNVVAKGSARQYFSDQSDGQYAPQFDVVGPVTVSKNMAYYGGNNAQGQDKKPEQMVKEACQLAHDAGADFSLYDNDNDGKVDFVYVVYAGYNEADGGGEDCIWPHSFHLTYSSINLTLDGKKVDLYACGSELSYVTDHRDGIGTFCHEFGHVMGLPDIYETTYENNWKTSGQWDIMDSGCYNNDGNTPPSYTGYECFFFGWITPRQLKELGEVTIKELQEFKDVCVMTEDGSEFNNDGLNPSPSTFYILENRQQKGWDKFIPGHGLMLTKIIFSQSRWNGNSVNDSEPLAIDIIEADGKAPKYNENKPNNGFAGKSGDCFPAGATEYQSIGELALTAITETNEVIRFQLTNAQGIESVQQAAVSSQKIIHNRQLYILRDGLRYNLLGAPVE